MRYEYMSRVARHLTDEELNACARDGWELFLAAGEDLYLRRAAPDPATGALAAAARAVLYEARRLPPHRTGAAHADACARLEAALAAADWGEE